MPSLAWANRLVPACEITERNTRLGCRELRREIEAEEATGKSAKGRKA